MGDEAVPIPSTESSDIPMQDKIVDPVINNEVASVKEFFPAIGANTEVIVSEFLIQPNEALGILT